MTELHRDLPLALFFTAGAIDAAEHGRRDEAKKSAIAAIRAARPATQNAHYSAATFFDSLMHNARRLRPNHPREAAEIVAEMLSAADRLDKEAS